MRRRVVVTGIGLVTPLGIGAPVAWSRLLLGRIACRSLLDHHDDKDSEEYRKLPCTVAARVDDETDRIAKNADRSFSDVVQFALVAAQEALDDAAWHPSAESDRVRTGVAIGSGIGSLADTVEATLALRDSYKKVSPFFIPRMLVNMAAGQVSIRHQFQGPNHAASTACATGVHAIGDAYRMIQHDDADVMVAGGTESCIHPVSIAGFCRMRALCTKFNDKPSLASRPFDKQRDGFVMGEGCGIVVLEELQHALDRNAKIYAEVCGYGLSGDANHITAPSPEGRGALRAMQRALACAHIDAAAVDYINAHATSTPIGDNIEARAIAALLSSGAETRPPSKPTVAVSSTKGAIGHLLGAAGAVESVFSILAIRDQVVPPTVNLDELDPTLTSLPINFVAHEAVQQPVRVSLCNSFGFGGTNACICFRSYPDSA